MTMPEPYDYKAPRRFNIVTLFVLLFIGAATYAGIKFGPVYWQGREVDEILDEQKLQLTQADLARLDETNRNHQIGVVIGGSLEAIRALGIVDYEEQPIEVFYSDDFTTLHARYMVVVEHPYGKPTVMTMNRKVKVP
jgi:hypothetical protein